MTMFAFKDTDDKIIYVDPISTGFVFSEKEGELSFIYVSGRRTAIRSDQLNRERMNFALAYITQFPKTWLADFTDPETVVFGEQPAVSDEVKLAALKNDRPMKSDIDIPATLAASGLRVERPV